MKKKTTITTIILLAILSYSSSQAEDYFDQNQLKPSYQELLSSISEQRKKIRIKYLKSGRAGRSRIIKETRAFLISSINQIFPYWYGTKWEFYGTSQVPQQGAIACGYFVTHILRDLGLKIRRIRLAQQASETMIKNLTPKKNIKRYSNLDIETLVSKLSDKGQQVYIVGLDYHTGFVVSKDGNHRFVHSSYYSPKQVLSEPIDSYNPLKHSKYRVFGKIFDEKMIKKWILGKAFPLRYRR